jgi:TM2 domain-containing membrane protein YozV
MRLQRQFATLMCFVPRNDKKMKIFTYIVIGLSLLTIIFNIAKISLEKPFEGESTIALIGIIASFCAMLIVTLLMVARKVVEQTK